MVLRNMASSSLHRIVVVGGGAGGLELATNLGRRLGKKKLALPTLVDGKMTHIWKPLLHKVATGSLNTGEEELNYFSHGHQSGYDFQFGWMKGLDRKRKVIQLDEIQGAGGRVLSGPREVPYDTLIMAVGGVSNTFGTPGVDEHCFKLNNPSEAEALRIRILNDALSISMNRPGFDKLRIGIVGGGPTGVGLAAEIHHTICYLRNYGANLLEDKVEITILEGSPAILGGAPKISEFATEALRRQNIRVRTGARTKAVMPQGFLLQDGSLLEKDIKIWTAGIKAPDWLSTLGLKTNRTNQILVDAELRCVDDPSILAIGDCAASPHTGGPDPTRMLPPTAQVAHQQAELLLKKFEGKYGTRTTTKGEEEGGRQFLYKSQGMLVSLGKGMAVGTIVGPFGRNIFVSGRGAKVLYYALYRSHQGVLYGVLGMAFIWSGDKLRNIALPQLKLH